MLSDGPLLTSLDAKKLIQNKNEDDEDALPLVFKGIQFQYNFEPGSEASIQFLDVLKDANLETFRSPTIHAILNYKWSLVRYQAYFLATMYLSYIVMLFINIEYGTAGGITTLILLAFGIYFLLFEAYQIIIRPSDYFTDFWNIFDLFRALLLLYYAGTDWAIGHDDEKIAGKAVSYVLAALNLLSWMRAISYLRLF